MPNIERRKDSRRMEKDKQEISPRSWKVVVMSPEALNSEDIPKYR